MNLAAFGVHHDGDSEALLVVEPPDAVDDLLVPLPGAVAHVDSGDVHASDGEGLQLVEAARGGAHSADELGPARAAEAVLLELGLRDGVHLDGARIGGGRGGGTVVVGDQDFRGGGGAEGGEAAVGGGAREEEGGRWEVGGNGGGGRGEEAEVEGV